MRVIYSGLRLQFQIYNLNFNFKVVNDKTYLSTIPTL